MSAAAPVVVRLANDEREFRCAPGATVLAALAPVHRLKIESGCRGGGCGVCRVKIVEGTCSYGKMSAAHVSAEDRDNGIVLACQARPTSDLIVEVLGPLLRV